MVDKIKSVDSATAAKKIAEKEELESKKIETKKKQEELDKSKKTDMFQTTTAFFADYQIKSYAEEHVNRLLAKYEGYDDIISRLRSYLGNFDIYNFKKNYPELESNSDLATAMYNDTSKLL